MKKLITSLCAVSALSIFADQLVVEISSDHTNALYMCGEKVTFVVSGLDTNRQFAAEGKCKIVVDNFTAKGVLLSEEVDFSKGNPQKREFTFDKPGFYRCMAPKVGKIDRFGKYILRDFVWGVGVEPEKIEKGSPSPADFDSFWEGERRRLAAEVPLDPVQTTVPEKTDKNFDYYRISFATFGGNRVHGYMSVPKDRSKGPFPVEFTVPGAGFGDWTNVMNPKKGRVCVFMSVFPFEPDWRYLELKLSESRFAPLQKALKEKYGVGTYSLAGIAGRRDENYYHPVILGIDRAVDWVASQPFVDKSCFWYSGTSQGGAMGLCLCGLNKTFTKAALYVPAMTDTMGYLKGRVSGWPKPVESSPEDQKEAAAANAPYYDGANFASRIKCRVRVAVGFSDVSCPPAGVYATYNELKVKDRGIIHGIGMSHSCYGWVYDALDKWLEEK